MGAWVKLFELVFYKLPVLLFSNPIRAFLVIGFILWFVNWCFKFGSSKRK